MAQHHSLTGNINEQHAIDAGYWQECVAIATVAVCLRWGSYFAVLANHDLRHFRKLIRAAVQLLPFPSVQLDGSTYYNRFRALGAFNSASEDSIS